MNSVTLITLNYIYNFFIKLQVSIYVNVSNSNYFSLLMHYFLLQICMKIIYHSKFKFILFIFIYNNNTELNSANSSANKDPFVSQLKDQLCIKSCYTFKSFCILKRSSGYVSCVCGNKALLWQLNY